MTKFRVRMAMRFLPTLAVLLACAAPAQAGRSVPRAFYGMNWDREIAAAPADIQDAAYPRMAASGVETLRTAFSWARAQPVEGGAFDHSATDAVVARAVARRMRVLPIVIQAPAWARQQSAFSFSPPRRASEYAAYLRALVDRYGPNGSFWAENPGLRRAPIREWQIWNEPHLPYQWSIGRDQDWARGYVRVLKAADRALGDADPKALVVLAGLTNSSPGHLRELYQAGAGGHFDVAAIHPYTRRPKDTVRLARRFRTVMRKHGNGRKPLWATELGLPASKGRTDSDSWLQTTDKGMATWLRKTHALFARAHLRRAVGVTRLYWYTWASDYRGDIFDFSGLHRYRSGGEPNARPAWRAYRASARKHQGCRKGPDGRCRVSSTDSG